MAPTANCVTVLENCRVSPPPGTVAEKSLPLTYFDVIWLPFHSLCRVIFYDYPYSKTEFTENIVPNLKTSLSLALKHFIPFAGNLITKSSAASTTIPEIRYTDGDSVSVISAECTSDVYIRLTAYHARDVEELSQLVPKLPEATSDDEGCTVAPLFAVQVTLFPYHGICIGFANSHVVADGSTMFNFIQAWASIARDLSSNKLNLSNDDAPSTLLSSQIPFYDRSVIKDPKGIAIMFMSYIEQIGEHMNNLQNVGNLTNSKKVQATFFMNKAEIGALKNLVSVKRPTLAHLSSFTVVCAYIWTCIAKTRAEVNQETDDKPQHFTFMMDCRSRLDPPISATYFGNCIVGCMVNLMSSELLGGEGLVTATEMIGEEIKNKANNSDSWFSFDMGKIKSGEFVMGVAGSPKMDYYNRIDFGLGRPKKFEFVGEPFSISRCKNSEGDLEMGLCLPEDQMEAFSSIFRKGIQDLLGHSV